jgi:hypothetical protein
MENVDITDLIVVAVGQAVAASIRALFRVCRCLPSF